jgi:membrane-associated phospholipid phosphatase
MLRALCKIFIIQLGFCLSAYSQQSDTSTTKQHIQMPPPISIATMERDSVQTWLEFRERLTIKEYSSLLAYNFKRQAFFPFYLKKRDWLKVGGYALATGAIALANEPAKEYAIKLHDNNQGISTASKYITRFGGPYAIYTLGGLLASGAVLKNEKLKTTTLLATQSYIISNLVGGGAKILFSVQGPFYTDPITKKTGAYFHGPFYTLKKGPDGKKLKSTNYVSFPSGHTYTAFSIATVFAMEYRDKPFIPILCYSTATLVGLSRLTENRHWAMDILPGALLGYYSAKQVVKSYHRRNAQGSKLKATTRRSASFNLQYINNQVIPGMIYKF